MTGRVLFAVLLIALAGQAWAQAAGDYFTDPKSHCKLWWPSKEPWHSDGEVTATYAIMSVKWNGTCGKGMAQGHGTFEVAEKFQHKQDAPEITTFSGEGDFVDGKLTGRGFMVTIGAEVETRIEGEFRDGVLNGRGIKAANGKTSKWRSDGQYRDGKMNGWGVTEKEFIWTDTKFWFTERNEGEYRDDKLNGRGVQVEVFRGCSLQLRYEGEFADGLYHGRGTLKAFNGKVYTGIWERGSLNGRSAIFDLAPVNAEIINQGCR